MASPCVPLMIDWRGSREMVAMEFAGAAADRPDIRERAAITQARMSVYRVPTDAPEADGTYAWDSTQMVLVRLEAGERTGLGYTYADAATGKLTSELLEKFILRRNAFAQGRLRQAMLGGIRNLGTCGIAMMAVSAIDNALWDLRARLLEIPLACLIGQARDAIPVYGSGGFTSYSDEQLTRQMRGWAERGFGMMKMKVGSDAGRDPHRVEIARAAIGAKPRLFVDANGAYSVPQAMRLAEVFSQSDVSWLEEPVSADNLHGLRQVRAHARPPAWRSPPANMATPPGILSACWRRAR